MYDRDCELGALSTGQLAADLQGNLKLSRDALCIATSLEVRILSRTTRTSSRSPDVSLMVSVACSRRLTAMNALGRPRTRLTAPTVAKTPFEVNSHLKPYTTYLL